MLASTEADVEDARLKDSKMEDLAEARIEDIGETAMDDAMLDAFVLDDTGLDGDVVLDNFVLVDAVLEIAVLNDNALDERLGDMEFEVTAIAATGAAAPDFDGVLAGAMPVMALDATPAVVGMVFTPHSALCAEPQTSPETCSQRISRALPAPISSLAAASLTLVTLCGGEISAPNEMIPL